MTLPTQNQRYGDLLKEFYQGIKEGNLSESRMADIQRAFNELSERENVYRSWMDTGGGITTKNIKSKLTDFEIGPSRSVAFTDGSPATILNDTYTIISFAGVRGLLYDLGDTGRNLACVKQTGGVTYKFTKQDWVPRTYPILFWGSFTFGANAGGSREVFIEFFNKSDVSLGGFTFAARAATVSDWTTVPFVFMHYFDDGDYCEFWVWQDSGFTLDLMISEFGFMLG